MFRTVEFILILMLLWTAVRMLLPSKRAKEPRKKPTDRPQRFDARGKDISDGEFEDLK